ncbi:MAG: glycosyltransferase [Chitinophagaceae bacterium]|nr:glycosyltransferase [Chitinophagaceae bacterium]
MFSKFMVMYSYKRADLILANSYAIQTDLIENFKIKTPVRVIYNPVDLQFIKSNAAIQPAFVFEKIFSILLQWAICGRKRTSCCWYRHFLR